MAKNKVKAADIVLVPASTTSKKAVEKLEIAGFEKAIDHLRGIKKQIEELETKFNEVRSPLVTLATDEKRKAEGAGKLYKTVAFASGCEVPAEVVFKNAFKSLDVSNERVMREALGPAFDELYKLNKTTSVKKNADLSMLKTLLGQENFDRFFETKEFIDHQEEFQEKRFALRTTLTQRVNDIVDGFTKQCQSQPDLRLGKVE